jgi:NADH-quinone oxidoreductase subunit N
MSIAASEYLVILPELFVLGMASLILVVDLFLREDQRVVSYHLTQLTMVGALVLTLATFGGETRVVFHGAVISDGLGAVLKVFVYLLSFAVFLYSRQYLRARELFKGEYHVLGLFAILGMTVLISAHHLLTLYLGLELLALSLYAMVAFHRDSDQASEAAMKYFVLGAIASGMLLYGISMLYGASGSLDIGRVATYAAAHAGQDVVLSFALVFVIAGLAFKLGAVPFHMWLPDVYHGAPTSVTLFLGAAPKLAAFAMLMRLLSEALGGLTDEWRTLLIVLSLLSLAVGNIVAIAQTNIKRMLAYSTISHAGFLLLGVLAGTPGGYSAAMFYIIIYSIMAAGAFGIVLLLTRAGFESERLDDFKGLNERSPWFAFIMLVLMFSMAGVPLTAGFFAKFSVLKAVVDADMVWLAASAVVFSIIGAFYYLRVTKLMYFDAPEHDAPLEADLAMRAMLSVNGLAVLWLGIFPGSLMALCSAALA